MEKYWRFMVLIFAGVFASAQIFAQTSITPDPAFAKKAALGGMTEVEASKLALQKTTDDRVRQFAQHMVDDHAKVGEALKSAASAEGIAVPTELDATHKQIVNRLQALSPAQFDPAYKTLMLDDHKDTLSLFENKVRENPHTQIKQFAADTLPTLRTHLEMAEELAGARSKGSASR